MARTVEIILGYVDKPVGAAAAGTSLIDQYNSDKKGFALVNQSAQTGAAVAGVISIVKLTAGFTPFLNIKTNTLAATTVFLKITAQYRTDKSFETGDILSLVGNVAGVVGSVILLTGAAQASLPFVAMGIGANVAGIVLSDVATKLYAALLKPLWERHFRANPKSAYPTYWVAPDLKLVSLAQIDSLYGNRIAVNQWDPSTRVVTLVGKSRHLYSGTIGSTGGYIENGHSGPMIFPLPEPPGWRIDIGPIEIVSPQGAFGIDRYH